MENSNQISDLSIKNLLPEEITNPNTVIEQFFRNYSLPECRAILKEILRQAFAGYASRQSIYPADMLSFWQELEKVTEALYHMEEQKKEIWLLSGFNQN